MENFNLAKNHENHRFWSKTTILSDQIHSRSPHLIEKLQFSRKIMKTTDFSEIGGK